MRSFAARLHRRLRALFRGAAVDRELTDEIRLHIEYETEELMRTEGLDDAEARRRALVAFGGVERCREEHRDARGLGGLAVTLRDLRQALRSLIRAPAFSLSSMLVLGLGIGMATAIFTICNAVLLRPLPVSQPDRLVLPRTLDPGGVDVGMTQSELKELVAASRTLTAAAGVAHQGAFTNSLLDGDRVLSLRGAWVTGNFFQVLGARPALGRFFTAAEEAQGFATAQALVLSYDTWRRDFHGDSGVIGRRVSNPYTRAAVTIVGVAPPGLAYPAGVEYWTPQVYPILDAVARLAPGVTPAAAQSEFFDVMRRIDARRVVAMTQGAAIQRADIESFSRAVLGDIRPELLVLGVAAALLLLMACLDAANLGLLRATARSGELSLRRSLGAGTGDIVRPLVWESTVIALGGGAVGFIAAEGFIGAFRRLAPPELPRLDLVGLAGPPVGLAAALAAVALLLIAVLPIVVAARGGGRVGLHLETRGGRSTRSRRRLRQTLVGAQVALALVLLSAAGLLVKSLDHLLRIDLGYRATHLAIVTITRPIVRDSAQEQMTALYDAAAPRIRAVPGVTALTPIAADPFYGPQVFTGRWAAAEQSDQSAQANPLIPWEVGGADYFRTFGIRLRRGRGFDGSERADGPRTAVVAHSVAERFWPGETPVGKHLHLVGDTSATRSITIVGEADDIRYRSLREATPTIYLPWRQWFFQGVVAIRTRGPLTAVLPALRQAVQAAHPEARIARAESMDQLLGRQLAVSRLSTVLVAAFGLGALLLSAVGLYGVMAAAVREETRELGIRSALGAKPAQLRASVLRRAAAIGLAGGAVGVTAALAAARFLQSLLYEVAPADPATLAAVCGVLFAVLLAAAFLPARRATRADPMQALRVE